MFTNHLRQVFSRRGPNIICVAKDQTSLPTSAVWLENLLPLRRITCFRGLKMAKSCQSPSIQVRHFLLFPLILVRFACGLKQIPQNYESNISEKDLVKYLLTSNQIFYFSPMIFCKIFSCNGHVVVIFQRYLLLTPCKSNQSKWIYQRKS